MFQETDPALGSRAQARALSLELRREFKRISAACFERWEAPPSQAGKNGLVLVRMALALGFVSRDGRLRVEYASVERANLADADLERCIVEQALGTEMNLPPTYQTPTGGLRSLQPLPNGAFRLWYPVGLGVAANRGAKATSAAAPEKAP